MKRSLVGKRRGARTRLWRAIAAAIVLAVLSATAQTAHAGEILTQTILHQAGEHRFGHSVAIEGDVMVVGSLGLNGPGRAFVYIRQGTQFVRKATLLRSDGSDNDDFGSAVAIAGGTIVVGAGSIDGSPGGVYVFVPPADGWAGTLTETARLEPEGGVTPTFGSPVAINDLGEVFASDPANHIVYVFARPSSGWSGTVNETGNLGYSYGSVVGSLGYSLSVSGDSAVIGWYLSQAPGSAYVYVRPAGGWTQDTPRSATLEPAAGAYDFGVSVAINGDIVVVGATWAAKAFVFLKPFNGWSGDIKSESAQMTGSPYFGWAVAVEGDKVLVGAPKGPYYNSFSYACEYHKPAGGWSGILTADSVIGDPSSTVTAFGQRVALSGDTTVISDPIRDAPSNSRGAVYVYLSDQDNDGVPDRTNNCPSTPNADQRDGNGNGIGDACEEDKDPPVITAPAFVTAEATGPFGATVFYTVTAIDAVIGAVVPACSPASGSTFALGTTAVTCTATDASNHAATATFNVTVVDTIAPVITATAVPLPNGSGWNNTDVTVSYACTDGGAGVNAAASDLSDDVLTASGTASGSCVDRAGNTAAAQVTVKIDKVAPVIALVSRTPANGFGWNNTGVTVVWSCSDGLSGVVAQTITRTAMAEVAGQSVAATCYDRADNSSSDVQAGISIDRTAPSLEITGIADGASYVIGAVPSADYTATDALAGIAAEHDVLSCMNPSGVGSCTYTVQATDKAGNEAIASARYAVVYGFSGFLAPVSLAKPFKLGSTIPVKFQLTDASGGSVPNAVATMMIQQFSGSEPVGEPIDAMSTSSADSGNAFRYSTTDNLYIYNLNTKGLSTGTWQIRATLDDGTVKTAFLQLK